MEWSELKAELRMELEDEGVTPKWSDATLYMYLREALADYSQYFPYVAEASALTVNPSNSLKFALPSDFIEELDVVCGNRVLEFRKNRSGSKIVSGVAPLFYYIEGTSLHIDVDPGENDVALTYNAVHPKPSSASDDTFTFTIPDVDVELIKLYILGKVFTRVRSSQSKLDRFKITNGERTDNPMRTETNDYFNEYYKKIAERVRPKTHYLSRTRRYK